MPHEKDETTILEWKAPGRPFKKRSRQFFLTALIIMFFVEVILFLFAQYSLMLVVFALIFVTFVLESIPPRDFHYKITVEGVMIEDIFYLWKELYDFYIIKKAGNPTVHIRTEAYYPGELVLTMGDMSIEKAKDAISAFLPFREYVKPTFMEKSADWLSKNFPLEKK